MADSPRADDGKGPPKGSQEKTTTAPPRDFRLIPGGRAEAPAVGMNAVDREDLPSQGQSSTDYKDTPDK